MKRHKIYTIEEVKEYIESFGFLLNSKQYVNNKSVLEVVCPNGHKYKVSYAMFKQGQRCGYCCKNKSPEFKDVKSFINSQKYKLISKTYKNAHTKLIVECNRNHRYGVTWDKFKQGRRCAKCIKCNIKYTMEEVREMIKKHGFTLLSKKYKSVKNRMKVMCRNKHITNMTLDSIINNKSQCSTCNHPKKREVECRRIFEKITKRSFPTKRPKFLINPETGSRLELDGYCEELNMAFEYDGEMHYKPVFGIKSLKKQQKRDKIKDKLCKNCDIILIRIPYWTKDLRIHITKELEKHNECN